MEQAIDQIRKENLGSVKENIPFKAITTYKTGGNLKYLIAPTSVENLIKLLKILKEKNLPFKVFGNGSNILVSDKDYNGVIIRLSELNNIEKDGEIIRVGAGYNLVKLASDACNDGLSGLEWACGIPGTIGGAIYMNAGAYLKSMSDVVLSVDALDSNLNFVTFTNADLHFSYRKSLFMENNYIILGAIIKLEKKDKQEILKVILDRKNRRFDSQPLEYPSAGSVFRNPLNDHAGRLIEECGLKGYVIGGAKISDKHANFIINNGNATSSDIKTLMELAKTEVKKKFNIDLKVEQELFNWE